MGAKSKSLSIEDVMGAGGKLAQAVEGYAPRSAQIAMAKEVAQIIQDEETFLAEAGTGTGKTFAYLIPSLLSGKKVIVSTATKTLQEQLVHKDLPLLFKVCGIKGKAHILKGRDNYVCTQRLDMTETAEQHSREDWKKLAIIREWLEEETRTGDRAEVVQVAEDDMIWRKVAARMEFCQSTECNADCGWRRIFSIVFQFSQHPPRDESVDCISGIFCCPKYWHDAGQTEAAEKTKG